MEYIISEHNSNWNYFSLLFDNVHFTFEVIINSNSRISTDGIIFNGKKEGIWMKNFKGNFSLSFYKNDLKEGKMIVFNHSEILHESTFTNDKIHGKKISYYKGKKNSEINYFQGLKNGSFLSWDEDGSLIFHVIFKDNKRIGIQKF